MEVTALAPESAAMRLAASSVPDSPLSPRQCAPLLSTMATLKLYGAPLRRNISRKAVVEFVVILMPAGLHTDTSTLPPGVWMFVRTLLTPSEVTETVSLQLYVPVVTSAHVTEMDPMPDVRFHD